MPPFVDRTNKRYGRLIALRMLGKNSHNQLVWECVCDCGTVIERVGFQRISCGCLLKESAARNGRNTKGCKRPDIVGNTFAVKHGACRSGLSPEYISYQAAKQRCNDPKVWNYADYGGRGIKFLFTSFEQWLAELGPRSKGTTVDRIANEGNYEPGNVRWATPLQQRQNQRKTRKKRCLKQQS